MRILVLGSGLEPLLPVLNKIGIGHFLVSARDEVVEELERRVYGLRGASVSPVSPPSDRLEALFFWRGLVRGEVKVIVSPDSPAPTPLILASLLSPEARGYLHVDGSELNIVGSFGRFIKDQYDPYMRRPIGRKRRRILREAHLIEGRRLEPTVLARLIWRS